MASQVRGDDMKAVSEALGDPVPVSAVVPAPVDQQEGRGAFVTPIDIMKAQALADVGLGAGSGAAQEHGRSFSVIAGSLAV